MAAIHGANPPASVIRKDLELLEGPSAFKGCSFEQLQRRVVECITTAPEPLEATTATSLSWQDAISFIRQAASNKEKIAPGAERELRADIVQKLQQEKSTLHVVYFYVFVGDIAWLNINSFHEVRLCCKKSLFFVLTHLSLSPASLFLLQ